MRDNRQNNRIIQLLEDKENICPNNNINFSIRNVKTGYFGSNQEDEKVQINNSFRPKISKKILIVVIHLNMRKIILIKKYLFPFLQILLIILKKKRIYPNQ